MLFHFNLGLVYILPLDVDLVDICEEEVDVFPVPRIDTILLEPSNFKLESSRLMLYTLTWGMSNSRISWW